MNHSTTIRLSVLFALFFGGCAEPEQAPDARLAINVQGLSGTVELEVPAGEYEIEADGVAEDGVAHIEVIVRDANGDAVASSSMQLPAGDARAREGDVGHGQAPVTAVPGRVTDVQIPFHWQADTPDSGWNVDLRFERGPDISYWTVNPAPAMVAGRPFTMEVGVRSEDDPADIVLTCDLGPNPCDALVWDPARNAFVGGGIAPDAEGLYQLTVDATDSSGTSQIGKQIEVVAWDAALVAPGRTERRLGGGNLAGGARWELVEVSAPPFTTVTEFRYDANGDGDYNDVGDQKLTKEGTFRPLGDAADAPQGADADGDGSSDTNHILVDGVDDGQRQGTHVFVINQDGSLGHADWVAPRAPAN